MRKTVYVKNVAIGGNHPVVIQSMTNTDTLDVAATSCQIERLAKAGADIVRLAVSSQQEVLACKQMLACSPVPLVADIQFDYRLAVACADVGFGAIRFNPGNIGSEASVKEVVAACKHNNVPIRIGVNLGSLEKEIEHQYGRTAEALVESTLKHVHVLEKYDFSNIVLSAKASDVKVMIDANRQLHKKTLYPLHLGVTESGIAAYGTIKSAIGIGALLADGIGDTIRVSLTGDPCLEIPVAKDIVRASGRSKIGVEIVSCPTCSRCKYDMTPLVEAISKYTQDMSASLKIAIMGCVVNGPGEAKDADIGACGGAGKCALFKKGKVLQTVDAAQVEEALKKLIDSEIHF